MCPLDDPLATQEVKTSPSQEAKNQSCQETKAVKEQGSSTLPCKSACPAEQKILLASPLFANIQQDFLWPLLTCLQVQKHRYHKGQFVFSAGEKVTRLGLVLSGRVNTVSEDLFGNRAIIWSMGPGQLFCDAFSCTNSQSLPVSIVAQTDSEVLLIEVDKILHTCSQNCPPHKLLTENLVQILAEKYATLNQKVVHLSGRTTRRKLLSYFSEQAQRAGGQPFTIPFNQQELADYLFLERSGLSTELNRLKKEGKLEKKGSRFILHAQPCVGNDCEEEKA